MCGEAEGRSAGAAGVAPGGAKRESTARQRRKRAVSVRTARPERRRLQCEVRGSLSARRSLSDCFSASRKMRASACIRLSTRPRRPSSAPACTAVTPVSAQKATTGSTRKWVSTRPPRRRPAGVAWRSSSPDACSAAGASSKVRPRAPPSSAPDLSTTAGLPKGESKRSKSALPGPSTMTRRGTRCRGRRSAGHSRPSVRAPVACTSCAQAPSPRSGLGLGMWGARITGGWRVMP
mmetsp:Transcript_22914/g.71716  ORF Transcript_22914/g.71716 Transcript_22914/m.71716 type:complete len:235 (-) Transcript_22914:213-917(-)